MPYELTKDADEDLVTIYLYTENYFGTEKAENYVRKLHKAFSIIKDNPNIGKKADDLKVGMRRYIFQKHIIFYEQEEHIIIILAILHHKEDIQNYFL